MNDTHDSIYNRKQILELIQRIVAKRISHIVTERLSDVQTDMYTFYAFILNQFIENENKQFQFIREGIKAYSDSDGVWLAKSEDDSDYCSVESIALPLKLDQYLNTVTILSNNNRSSDYDFVFDNESVESYFIGFYNVDDNFAEYIEARTHHYLNLRGTLFTHDNYLLHNIYKSIDLASFRALINDDLCKTILNSISMSKLSMQEVDEFSIEAKKASYYSDLYRITARIEKEVINDEIDSEIDKICSSVLNDSSLVDTIRSELSSIPIKEPPVLRREGINVNFLLDLDNTVDPISRIAFYWSYYVYRRSNSDIEASDRLKIARLILIDKGWLSNTCDMIKRDWLNKFKYNIYNTSVMARSFDSLINRGKGAEEDNFEDDLYYSKFSMFKLDRSYDFNHIFYRLNLISFHPIDDYDSFSSHLLYTRFIDSILKDVDAKIRYYKSSQENIDCSYVVNTFNILLVTMN